MKLLQVAALLILLNAIVPSALSQSLPVDVNNPTAGVLDNYTVRVELTAANAPGFDFAGDGSDIAVFTDDRLGQYDFYVESVDPVSQVAVVWVRIPALAPSPPDTTFLLDYNRTDLPPAGLSNAANTFVEPGYKWHSQFYNDPDPGPETRAAGEAIFNFDVVEPPASGRSCVNRNELDVDNQAAIAPTGANMDYGLFIETILLVSTPGDYEFRLGTDLGHGGELYVDGVTLEEGWTEDLWWALDYNNPDVLLGTINLDAGPHTLRALGFERCCDGSTNLQYRFDRNGNGSLADDVFEDLTGSTTDLLARATSCPLATVTIGPAQTVPVTLAKFESSKIGPFIRLQWETADESFNLGFDIWTLETDEQGEESLRPVSTRIIRSRSFDSMSPQRYRKRLRLDDEIDNLVLSSMDTNGAQEFFGPFNIGERYGADIEPQPIDWQSVHQDFVDSMRAQGYVRVHNRWRKQRPIDIRPSTVAQLWVEDDGVYRVYYEDLKELGLDWRGVNHRRIALTHDGQALPRKVSARRFGPGEYIDFVGLAPRGELALYQGQRSYQLQLNRTLARNVVTSRREANAAADWVYDSIELREINLYSIGSPSDTPWMMSRLFRLSTNPVSQSFALTLPGNTQIPPQALARLSLALNSVVNIPLQDVNGDGSLDDNHRFAVYLNGQQLIETAFGGQKEFPLSIDFSADLLESGQNQVTIELLDSGYRVDTMSVESMRLDYPTTSNDGHINGVLIDSDFNGVSIDESFNGVAYQYDENHNMLALPMRASDANRLVIPLTATPQPDAAAKYLFLADKPLALSQIEVAAPTSAPELIDAQLLVIAHPSFLGKTLDDYLQQRGLQGVSSQVIDSDAIQQHFGRDVSLPVALQRFLRFANEQIDFESVLLIGGHSYDYRQYLSAENVSFIPSFYRRIGFSNFTPSDLPLVDFNQDSYPDKAIGRWPVRTNAELATITSKSLRWVSQQAVRKQQGHDLLMMADRREQLDFSEDSETQLAILQTQDLDFNKVSRFYLDEVIADPELDQTRLNEEIQERSFAALNSSPSWVYYNGHGSPTTWSSNGLLNSARVVDLENDGFLVTSVGCFTTYFEDPSHNTLAHQLMFADENGAVVIHGPAVVGDYHHQRRLAELITQNSDKSDQIGQTIVQGMLRLPINYSAILPNWTLLGDPTLPLQ